MLQHLLETVVVLAKYDSCTQFSWIQSPEDIPEYYCSVKEERTVQTVDTLRATEQKLKLLKLTDKNRYWLNKMHTVILKREQQSTSRQAA
jgi:hypothetical protein